MLVKEKDMSKQIEEFEAMLDAAEMRNDEIREEIRLSLELLKGESNE